MEKIKTIARSDISIFWNSLPRTAQVFCYMVISTILAETLIELGNMQKVFLVRVLAQIINLALVLIKDLAGISKNK